MKRTYFESHLVYALRCKNRIRYFPAHVRNTQKFVFFVQNRINQVLRDKEANHNDIIY